MSDLRARLRALVEEWRKAADMQTFEAANAKRVCALDLAALLDETEEGCRHGKDCVECEQEREPGQCEGMEPEPKSLQLGHDYKGCSDCDCTVEVGWIGRCHHNGCGQPREAHEVKPTK